MSVRDARVPLVAADTRDAEAGQPVAGSGGSARELQELKQRGNGALASEGERGGLNLEWRDIQCYVSEPRERHWFLKSLGFEESLGEPTKQICVGASGFARSGEVLAVMGPSGSGKTTLLNVLAQRATLGHRGYWTGQLLLNGMEPWLNWEREMAYVMQKDIFYEELKVRENLWTTAQLRLPYTWSEQRKRACLQQLVQDLGLEKVQETKVGSAIERGLSGGEVKRTSIVNESLAMPRIFLLDEPLTGLDSTRAVEVMSSLNRLAHQQGMTVMLTIHQPSSALYKCFDRLLLLGTGGRTAFFGSVDQAVEHFSKIGRPVPSLWTPSDHFIELLANPVSCQEVCELWATEPKEPGPAPRERPQSLTPMPPLRYQVKVLLPRAFLRISRSYLKRLNWKLHISLSIVWGFIYFNVGAQLPARLHDFVGAVFFIVAHWSWTPLFQGLTNFPREKEMLVKEKASKTYEVLAFFLSQVFAEAPLLNVLPLVFFAIVWPMAGLPFTVLFPVFLMIVLNIQACASMSMLISTTCMDEDAAIPTAIIVMVFQMCAGGYFADMRLLPWWIGWVRFTSLYYYTFGSILRLMLALPYGEAIHRQAIAKYSFSELGYFLEVVMMLGMIVVFRVAAYLQLRFSKKLKFS